MRNFWKQSSNSRCTAGEVNYYERGSKISELLLRISFHGEGNFAEELRIRQIETVVKAIRRNSPPKRAGGLYAEETKLLLFVGGTRTATGRTEKKHGVLLPLLHGHGQLALSIIE